MTQKQKIWTSRLIFIALLILTIINQLYWRFMPSIAIMSAPSKRATLNIWLHVMLSGATAITILILGHYFKQKKYTPAIIGKLWGNLAVLGFLIALVASGIWSGGTAPLFCDSILPILRNASPIISGILLGYLFTLLLNKTTTAAKRNTTYVILAVLTVASLLKPNIFGWQMPNAILYAAIFILGYSLDLIKIKHLWQTALISLIATFVLNVAMQFLVPGPSSWLWYAGLNSIAIIFPAVTATKCLLKYFKFNLDLPIVASIIVIMQSPMLNGLVTQVAHGDHHVVKTMLYTIATALVILFAAWIWSNVLKLSIPRHFATIFDKLAKHSAKQNKTYIVNGFKHYLPTTSMFALSYILALIMPCVLCGWMFQTAKYSTFTPAWLLVEHQLMLLFTALLLFLLMISLRFITRRYWVSVALVSIFTVVLTIASVMKIKSRQEPILPSDMSEVSAGSSLMSLADKSLLALGTILVIAIIAAVVYLEIKHPVKTKISAAFSLVSMAALVAIFASSYTWNEDKAPTHYIMSALGDNPRFVNQLDGARKNGPIVQFMNNLDLEVMKEPSGYSREKMDQIYQKYTAEANVINQNRKNNLKDQTIIFNLSESFANPNRVPGVKLANSPIPNIQKLKDESTSGIMMSSGYGGGTANMEWMTLTGLNLSSFLPTMQVPYTQLVPNQNHPQTIVKSFDYAAGIHPYNANYYSRIPNYKKFGFDQFAYLGSKYPIVHQKKIDNANYISDETAYTNLYDQIQNRQDGQFINLITMQNHMPYDQHDYKILKKYKATSVSNGTNVDNLNNYTTRLHYTDKAVKQFIKKIDKLNKPITIVFYGDHLPGLYANDISVDNLKMHETDYFIYSNKYARAHGMGVAKMTGKDTNFVDPQAFIPMVAAQTNSKLNWYQALLNAVWQHLPAMSLNQASNGTSNTDRIILTNSKSKQVSFKSLTDVQKEIWHDYQLIQYDQTAGKHYLNDRY